MVAEDDMNVSLYVGDLHSEVSEVNLLKLFGESNISSCRVVRDVTSKRSRGYAYVNFNSHDAAERAHDKFNQVLFLGKPIRLMWAVKNPEKRRDCKSNVFIKNIDKSVDSRTIYEAFRTFGTISSFKICTDDFGHSLGYGFIHFESEEEADHAIGRVNGIIFKNKAVTLAKFKTKKERNVTQQKSFNNLFVKNFLESDVLSMTELFKSFGNIQSSDYKHSTRENKCFGFYCYDDSSSAVKAVECMNGVQVPSGLKIFVTKAMKKNERAAELKRNREAWRDKMHNETKNRNLYVRNFPETWKDDDLRDIFAQFGEITSCKIMIDSNSRSKLFGFVCFKSEDSANDALDKKATVKVNERPLFIVRAQTKDERRYTMAKQFGQMKSSNQNSQPRVAANSMAIVAPQAVIPNYPGMDMRQQPSVQSRNMYTPAGVRGPMANYLYAPSNQTQAPVYGRSQPYSMQVNPQVVKNMQQKPGEFQNTRMAQHYMQGQANYRVSSSVSKFNTDHIGNLKQAISGLLKMQVHDDFASYVNQILVDMKRSFDSCSENEIKNYHEEWLKQHASK